jgi:hypothetical protein
LWTIVIVLNFWLPVKDERRVWEVFPL